MFPSVCVLIIVLKSVVPWELMDYVDGCLPKPAKSSIHVKRLLELIKPLVKHMGKTVFLMEPNVLILPIVHPIPVR